MGKLFKLKENLVRGDTPVLSFPMTVGGAAVSLVGYVIELTITASQNPAPSDTPIIQIPVNGDSTGVCNFQLLADQALNATSNLVPGTTYYFDVQIYNSQSGTLKRVLTAIRGQLGVDANFNRVNS